MNAPQSVGVRARSKSARLRVVLIKPSKYAPSGYVERFRRGFMPNATLCHMRSLTPSELEGVPVAVHSVDEYVETDLAYMSLLSAEPGTVTLVALVGVQSHQLQRALDLAATARERGVRHVIIGGPHAMTCDTSALQGRGVAFALAEGELIWTQILEDALRGELAATYGRDQRWQEELTSPVLLPPSRAELKRHVVPMLGIYPARGCPYRCSFCSVIKIAGQTIRNEPVETTMASLRAAKAAGVRMIMFTSDNFNKYTQAPALLQAMIDEEINLPIFVQCDTQVAKQEDFVELLGRAGAWQMFVGVESLDRTTLLKAKKAQNHPDTYRDIIDLCHRRGITAHFSNIFGFPDDDAASIRVHLDAIKALSPEAASYYVLTPIPGTEQYDDFRREGLIVDDNLDRFDGSHLVWKHPHLSRKQLNKAMLRGYVEQYSPRNVGAKILEWRARTGRVPPFGAPFFAATWLFHWQSALRGRHPMAGGLFAVRRDRDVDYLPARRAVFDVERVPLPNSLPTPVARSAPTPGPLAVVA
jgi:radical SAM superfamily enzyme YgiQ (UPF0313 family)